MEQSDVCITNDNEHDYAFSLYSQGYNNLINVEFLTVFTKGCRIQ